jgi:hypothetical protein
MPSPKRRQLILTEFPRLFTVKEGSSPPALAVKSECVFVANSQTRRGMSRGEVNARVEQGAAGWVLDVQDKGPKGFTVQTVSVCPWVGVDVIGTNEDRLLKYTITRQTRPSSN